MKHLIGAGHVAERIINSSPKGEFKLYDNNEDLQGTSIFGIKINPVKILSCETHGEIVICTTSVGEIINQISDLDTRLNYTVADEVSEFLSVYTLSNFNCSFLLASGLPSNNMHMASGGLYKVTLEQECIDIKKILESPCHGIKKKEEGGYFVTDQHRGVVEYNGDLEEVKIYTLPQGLRPHGITCNQDYIFVVCSNDDSIAKISRTTGEIDFLRFSDKKEEFGAAQHHANDIEIHGKHIYVSMFSVTGNWKKGVYDGGLLEININTGSINIILNDLRLPHSVRLINEKLTVLNSYDSMFYSWGVYPEYRFNGFLRGVECFNQYLFFAESRNRNSTGLIQKNTPATIDSKINIVDTSSGYAKTIMLPPSISEIHSICLIT
jgi:hypothetical protein